MFTWIDFKPANYEDYEFPLWANLVGWILSFSSVLLIPIVAGVKIYQSEGTFSQVSINKQHQLKNLMQCKYFAHFYFSSAQPHWSTRIRLL